MKNKKKYILSVLLFLTLLIGTYYFVLKGYPLQDFMKSLKSCNPKYILLSFILVGSYVFFASFYLKRMLYHFGKKISWYHAIGYLCTEIYFSAITPSSIGGQPVQMIEMSKDKIPYRINSVVVLLNTIIYKIALIFLAIIAFMLYPNLIFTQSKLFSWLVILGFVTTILVIGLFMALIYSKKLIPEIAHIGLVLLEKLHLVKNREEQEKKLKDAMKEYQACAVFTKNHPSVLIEAFFILLGQRISLLLISFAIYISFGLKDFSVFQILAFQICITLASDFVPSPGGVGVSEGLLLQVNQLIYGVILETPAMMLLRGISFYIVVLLSGIYYVIFHFVKRKGAKSL